MVEPLYGTAELGFVFVNLHIDVASQVKKTMMLLVALFTGEPDDGVLPAAVPSNFRLSVLAAITYHVSQGKVSVQEGAIAKSPLAGIPGEHFMSRHWASELSAWANTVAESTKPWQSTVALHFSVKFHNNSRGRRNLLPNPLTPSHHTTKKLDTVEDTAASLLQGGSVARGSFVCADVTR